MHASANENQSAAVDSARRLVSDMNSSVRHADATIGVIHWSQQSVKVDG